MIAAGANFARLLSLKVELGYFRLCCVA